MFVIIIRNKFKIKLIKKFSVIFVSQDLFSNVEPYPSSHLVWSTPIMTSSMPLRLFFLHVSTSQNLCAQSYIYKKLF